MKLIKVTRSDTEGSYTQPLGSLLGCIEGELDDIKFLDNGTTITLTIVEMTEQEYKNLPEFEGW